MLSPGDSGTDHSFGFVTLGETKLRVFIGAELPRGLDGTEFEEPNKIDTPGGDLGLEDNGGGISS